MGIGRHRCASPLISSVHIRPGNASSVGRLGDIWPCSGRSSCFRGQYRSRSWHAIRVFSDTSLGRPLALRLRDDPFRGLDIAARNLVVPVN